MICGVLFAGEHQVHIDVLATDHSDYRGGKTYSTMCCTSHYIFVPQYAIQDQKETSFVKVYNWAGVHLRDFTTADLGLGNGPIIQSVASGNDKSLIVVSYAKHSYIAHSTLHVYNII